MDYEAAAEMVVGSDKLLRRLNKKIVINKSTGCWDWIAAKSYGYGCIGLGYKTYRVHRLLYAMTRGAPDPNLECDHLCRNRGCVNPEHIEMVTHRENILRGKAPQAENAKKTHCPSGHPYDDKNTIRRRRGGRDCRICNVARVRNRRNAFRASGRCIDCGNEAVKARCSPCAEKSKSYQQAYDKRRRAL